MSLLNKISEGERIFITHGVDSDLRSDGRSKFDFRLVMIERNVIESCNGSAHVRSGNTDVLVGIKLELEEIEQFNFDKTNYDPSSHVQVFADISAIASPAFEGQKGDDITSQVESLFSKFLPDYLDLEKLDIVPDKSHFLLCIDIVVLECSSLATLIDIISIALKTALYDVKIPKINILSVEQNEFSVSEDEFEAIKLNVDQLPLVTTYTKIGDEFIVDATLEEEQVSIGTVSIAFIQPDQISLVKKIRPGSISKESMIKLYEKATIFGNELWRKFNEKINQQNMDNRGKITFTLD